MILMERYIRILLLIIKFSNIHYRQRTTNRIYQYRYVAKTIHKIIPGKPQYALQLWTSRNVIQVLFIFSIFNIYTPLYEFTCIEGYIKQNCLSFLAQSLQPRKKNGSWATYFVGLYLTAGMIINGAVDLSSLHSVLDIQNQNRNLKTQNGQKLIKYWLHNEIVILVPN